MADEPASGILSRARRLFSRHLYGEAEPQPEIPAPPAAPPEQAVDPALQQELRNAARDRTAGGESALTVEEVYTAAGLTVSGPGTVFQLQALFDSPELSAIDPAQRKGPVEMVLRSQGSSLEALVEDAIARDRALDQMALVLEEELHRRKTETSARVTEAQRELDEFRRRIEERIAALRAELEDSGRTLEQFRTAKHEEERRLASILQPFLAAERITLDTSGTPAPETEKPAGEPGKTPESGPDLDQLGKQIGQKFRHGENP